MKLAEQLEKGTLKKLIVKNKGTKRFRKIMKKLQHRAWRRYNLEMKPMYNRYSGWEL